MYRKFISICFIAAGLATAAAAGVLPKDSAEQFELTFWESIKESRHATDYEAYLQSYPKGRFGALARTRIARLRGAVPETEPAPAVGPATTAGASRAAAGHGAAAAATSPAPAQRAASHRPRGGGRSVEPTGATPGAFVTALRQTPMLPAPPMAEVRDCDACPVLVALPRGGFTMGSNNDDPSERPAFHVMINSAFAIGKYEITVEQWNICVTNGGCIQTGSDGDRTPNLPVRDISWDDARSYTAWLSRVTNKTYRLPSEAEWEYAARGNTTTRYWWGDQMTTGKANCKDCGEPWHAGAPAPSGSFAANPFGLFDMNGSVWEWVNDCWHASYQRAPSDGRSWEEPDCRVRVLRGGSWRQGAAYMPSSTRFKYDASVRQSQNGFRVARSIE